MHFVGGCSLSLHNSMSILMISKLFLNTLRLSWWQFCIKYSSSLLAKPLSYIYVNKNTKMIITTCTCIHILYRVHTLSTVRQITITIQ